MDGSSTKRYRSGTHRTLEPGQTLSSLERRMFECGITRVADVTGMDNLGIPTVLVVRPNARSTSVSSGRGVDLTAAKVSAIMSAVEQYHAEHVVRPLRLCSAFELRGDCDMLDIDRLPRGPLACSPRERILWTDGRTLEGNHEVFVPYELVHLDHRMPLPPASGFFPSTRYGLASGNTLEEAIVHGICELIEVDSLTLFARRSARERAERQLDLTTVDDALCNELLARFARANLNIAVWDVTTDSGLPCFSCWLMDESPLVFRKAGLVQGSGCHPSRTVALSRALIEAAARRVVRIVGTRDDVDTATPRASSVSAEDRATFSPAIAPAWAFREAPTFEGATLEQDIALLRQKLDMLEVKAAYVDLSRPNFPVRVVRAVASGLEGGADLPGYVPGARAQRIAAVRGAA